MPSKSVFTKIQALVEKKATLGLIQGRKPASINEWNLAQAMTQLKVPFQYQVRLGSGQGEPGGIILDFVAWTSTGPVAIPLRGGYWHRNSEAADNLADRIAQYYYGRVAPIMVEETQTIEAAIKAFRTKVGL